MTSPVDNFPRLIAHRCQLRISYCGIRLKVVIVSGLLLMEETKILIAHFNIFLGRETFLACEQIRCFRHPRHVEVSALYPILMILFGSTTSRRTASTKLTQRPQISAAIAAVITRRKKRPMHTALLDAFWQMPRPSLRATGRHIRTHYRAETIYNSILWP